MVYPRLCSELLLLLDGGDPVEDEAVVERLVAVSVCGCGSVLTVWRQESAARYGRPAEALSPGTCKQERESAGLVTAIILPAEDAITFCSRSEVSSSSLLDVIDGVIASFLLGGLLVSSLATSPLFFGML